MLNLSLQNHELWGDYSSNVISIGLTRKAMEMFDERALYRRDIIESFDNSNFYRRIIDAEILHGENQELLLDIDGERRGLFVIVYCEKNHSHL